MHARATIVAGLLIAAVPLDSPAQAQLSPQGIIGGVTRPLRQMLGHFGHFPRSYRHRSSSGARAAAPAAAAPALVPERDTQGTVKSRLGRAGPAAWVTAYEEVLGFAFWPDDYGAQFRSRGFDVIVDTITGRFEGMRASTRVATTGAARNDTGSDVAADQCNDTSSADNKWPANRVEQLLQLSDAQHATLDKVQSAANDTVKTINSNCRQQGDLSPADRLRALVQALWVVRDGNMAMRAPLKDFYESLTSAQKNSFAFQQPQNASPPDDKTQGENKHYQACAAQNIGSAERMVKEIEMKVKPDKTQAASLENLHKTSSDMAKLLIASCAQPIPTDPTGRLDSASDQITAINYAASNVQIALDDFYGRLSQTQKARFEATSR